MSSQIHQNYSTEMEATISHLVNRHLRASCTYLFLGFHVNLQGDAVEGVGHFEESAQHLLKMEKQ